MKIKYSTLILILFSLGMLMSVAQERPIRIEMPAKIGYAPFNTIACEEQGVLIFYPTITETGQDSISWSFTLLNTDLKEVWRRQIPLREDVSFLKGVVHNKCIYLLFHDTRKDQAENITVLMIYPVLRLITVHKGSVPQRSEVVDFDIFKDHAFIAANGRKGSAAVTGFSLVDGSKHNYTLENKSDIFLLDVGFDSATSDIYVTYKKQASSSKNELMVNEYSFEGTLIRNIAFPGQDEKLLINSAQYVPTNASQGIVLGSYGTAGRSRRAYDYNNYYNNMYYPYYNPFYYNNYYYNSYYNSYYNTNPRDYEDYSPDTDGYFTASISGNPTGKIQYHNFINFTNTQKYLSDIDALRIKQSYERKKNKKKNAADESEKSQYSLNYKMLMHDAVYHNGEIVLIGEAYYPEYRSNSQMMYDFYGRPFPSSYPIFDGYRYTNAFIAGFDTTGQMKWNNGFEMRDILTKMLNKKLNFSFDGNDLVLYYNANNKIGSKVIEGGKVVENTSFSNIAPLRGTDRIDGEYFGSVEQWYGDYYLLQGYQSVRNDYLSVNKRNVFYLSKMGYKE